MTDMAQADRTLRHTPNNPDKNDEVFANHRERVRAIVAKTDETTEQILIAVEIKTVYGKPLYYPINDKAQMLAHIAGTETLTAQTLKLAKDMGMRLEFTHHIPQEVSSL
jgi:hypothetical protein